MLFNSYLFILLFLPLALAGYFGCNARGKYEWGKLWLVAMSLWFYAWFNVKYLPIIVGSILGNYGLYRVLQGHGRAAQTGFVSDCGRCVCQSGCAVLL